MSRTPIDPASGADDDEAPHVPGFRAWRGVYVFVLGWFVLWVVALAAVTQWFNS